MERSPNETTVIRFIRAINCNDKQSILSFFCEDSVFHNIPMEPDTGIDAIWKTLAIVHERCSDVDWHLHAIAESSAGAVLTERTDRYLIDGDWIEYPLMGIFEVADGIILVWRDYFDLRQSVAQTPKHPRPRTNLLDESRDS